MLHTEYMRQPRRPPPPEHAELQAVVGRALVDERFRHDLLNGHRRECLAEFSLTEEEMAAAGEIQATDLSAFAAQLDRWIRNGARAPEGPCAAGRLAVAA